MKFYTRAKKPHLYDVLIAAVVVAAASVLISVLSGGGYALISVILYDAFFAYAIARLIIAFIGQLQYNPYSYNIVYYSGFALFLLFVLVTDVILTVKMITSPDLYGESMMLFTLTDSAKTYMIISAPFIAVFSVALCISNISLIIHEGSKPSNFIGIVFSLLLIGGEVFLFTADKSASGSQTQVMIHDILINLFAALYLYFECMIIGVITANAIVTHNEPEPDRDFIIILGCWIGEDGKITPLLRGRVERAIEFAEKQEKLTGKKAIFITSGGKGTDERMSESAAMKQCLMEHGIPEDRIIEEDQSTTTVENMVFSKKKIEEVKKDAKVAYATTGYHVFRSGIFARHAHIPKVTGIGSKTKWYFWPNAAVREFGGLLIEHRGKQAIIFTSLCLIYVVLTILAYR